MAASLAAAAAVRSPFGLMVVVEAAAVAAVAVAEEVEEEAMGRDALLLPGEGRKPTSFTKTIPGTEKMESEGGGGRERGGLGWI